MGYFIIFYSEASSTEAGGSESTIICGRGG